MPLASKQIQSQIQHVQQTGGKNWYIDVNEGNDSNSGLNPKDSFQTVAHGISVISSGETLNIKAGVYTEVGLDLNVNSTYLKCELGTVFQPATGTSLTISGDWCKLDGDTYILPTADNIGLVASGSGAVICNVTILGADSSVGIQASGLGCIIKAVKTAGIKAGGIGFELNGANMVVKECGASGCTTCIGFYMTSTIGLIENCFSIGNGQSSYYFTAAASGWTVKDTTSGIGDGRFIDENENNHFDGFSYDSRIEKQLDITQAGAGTHTYNLFKVKGVVKIIHIEGVVEQTLVGSNTAVYLDIYSVNGSDVLSKVVGLNMGASLKGSLVARLDGADKVLSWHDADQAYLIDQIDAAREGFRVGQDRLAGADIDTFIRFTHTTDGASSGEIDWYCFFEPVSEDAWLTAV